MEWTGEKAAFVLLLARVVCVLPAYLDSEDTVCDGVYIPWYLRISVGERFCLVASLFVY